MNPELRSDCIAAISTPIGEGAISIVRLSGEDALRIADTLFRSHRNLKPSRQKSFTSQVGCIIDPADTDGTAVDEVMLQVMRSPRSYTREDLVEIACHGGRQVTQRVLETCLKAGARVAEPGEFTKRAFLNGRIDLVQAEAVLDLIRSKTDRAREAAQRQLGGTFSTVIQRFSNRLADYLSHAEASVDFPDDAIDPMKNRDIAHGLTAIEGELDRLLHGATSGILVREGLDAVLVGKPNVGKSSLMNALSGTDRMIVSSRPGTTRDAVEEFIQVRGLAVRLVDTAGLGVSEDALESEASSRARTAMARADLVLFVVDGSTPRSDEERSVWEELRGKNRFLIVNKSDLPGHASLKDYRQWANGDPCVSTSCLTRQGIEAVEEHLERFILKDAPERSDEKWVGSVRHRDLLGKAREHVAQARRAFAEKLSPEFAASDMRLALDALGQITGEVTTDDVLDRIFQQFCIGK